MLFYKNLFKTTAHILIVITFILFSTLEAKNLEKYERGSNISDYFSGIVLLNQSKYEESFKFLKNLDGLERSHSTFSSKYLYSLVNSGNFYQAFVFSKKLEKEQKDSLESNLIIGVYYLKNSKYDLSNKYFLKASQKKSRSILDTYVINTLYMWSNIRYSSVQDSILNLNQLDERFENLKKIQKVFINCFFNQDKTELLFKELTSDKKTDFSRYNYFHAKYLESLGENKKAKKIVEISLKDFPRNLLLNQYKIDLENSKNNFSFNCKNEKDVVAELLYIAANALSSQAIYPLSNFYLNLSKYLNNDFRAFDSLLAENFFKIDDFSEAKKIYENLKNYGSAFRWYSYKQISRILILEKKEEKSIKLLKKSYNELQHKGFYETFDYAEFLKNNEEFEDSIKYYSEIINLIDKNHPLYPEVTDGRGVAYERLGQWDRAEKDLLESLKVSPNQAYVINYLAYSWIEQGIKIEKSLEMLKKANKLRSNDPYIIDSLGWALFKLERFQESKNYLQLAVRLMPADPIVNDHFGDVLWKNGNKIQARYYWNYVLGLEKAEKDLKEKIEKKLISGL
tara:strand:+ start:729 stop:2429 length:1701 start_codon:yes stop_codon:yes gene_type:complete